MPKRTIALIDRPETFFAQAKERVHFLRSHSLGNLPYFALRVLYARNKLCKAWRP
jgi:hypothetical protein